MSALLSLVAAFGAPVLQAAGGQGLATDLETGARNAGADASSYTIEEATVTMRDGVRLETGVVRPRTADRVPTVLVRTPYEMSVELRNHFFHKLFENRYAVVIQNERGTGWSEGQYQFLAGARKDGFDTLTWIAAQSWSNGAVGTFGCSSSAENQLALGAMRHPALRAQIAMSAGDGIGNIPGLHSQGLFYRNGVPALLWMEWYARYGQKSRPSLPAGIAADERSRLISVYSPAAVRVPKEELGAALGEAIWTLPSSQVLRSLNAPATDFDTFMTLTPADPRWNEIDFVTGRDTEATPTLHVSAWGDESPYDVLKFFEYRQGRPDQYLIMAPTAHCRMMSATEHTVVGDRDMGDARLPYEDLYLAWFDHYLKGVDSSFEGQPKVRVYLMGANVWLTDNQWPFAEVTPARYFLQSRGRANSVFGQGILSESPARVLQAFDEFTADPGNPVPSRGIGCCEGGVFRDQAPVESREDVLVYSTPKFHAGLAVLGDVSAVLYVSTSTTDSDIAFKLVDVDDRGRAINLQDSILRLRYRGGYEAPALMIPGRVYRIELHGVATANYFLPGHRLRIEIAGSNFPNYERNLNTGGHNFDETAGRVARIRIYHDARHPSYISVPAYPAFHFEQQDRVN